MSVHKTEPVLTGFVGLVAALIAVLVAFGVHLTPDQRDALVALAIAATPVVALIRSAVVPKHTLAKITPSAPAATAPVVSADSTDAPAR